MNVIKRILRGILVGIMLIIAMPGNLIGITILTILAYIALWRAKKCDRTWDEIQEVGWAGMELKWFCEDVVKEYVRYGTFETLKEKFK